MKAHRGYIAVVSAIIVSSILALVVFTSSSSVFITRFSQLDSEDKEQSKVLAFSCAYEALYAYGEDSSYNPQHAVIRLGGDNNGNSEECTIDSVKEVGSTLTVFVHASARDSYTALQIDAQTNPLSMVEWYEITSIPP